MCPYESGQNSIDVIRCIIQKNGMAFGDPHLLAVNCKSNVGTQTVYNLDVIGGT